jgi:DNA invertase Pin-like site-specific DNA recombinase
MATSNLAVPFHTAQSSEQTTRVGIYARVSTSNGTQSPQMQLREVREYCARRGFTVTGEYVDNGISGCRDRRPQLDRLLADCRQRRVDAVVSKGPDILDI